MVTLIRYIFVENLKPNIMENLSIIKINRQTGGLNPIIRFLFSDGITKSTHPDGHGVSMLSEKHQLLVSKWFNS